MIQIKTLLKSMWVAVAFVSSGHLLMAQTPVLNTIAFTADTSLTVRYQTLSDTFPLLTATHLTGIGQSETRSFTRDGIYQQVALSLKNNPKQGRVQVSDSSQRLGEGLVYALADAAALAFKPTMTCKEDEVTFFYDNQQGASRVLLSAGRYLSEPFGLPFGMHPLSTPVGIASWPAVESFAGTHTLQVKYEKQAANPREELAQAFYYWNASGLQWEPIANATQVDTTNKLSSVAVTKPGLYCLFYTSDYTYSGDLVVDFNPSRTVQTPVLHTALRRIYNFGTVDSTVSLTSKTKDVIYLTDGFHARKGSGFLTVLDGEPNRPASSSLAAARVSAEAKPTLVNDNEEDEKGKLRAYPNPLTHSFTLRYYLPTPQRVSVRVYDAYGREVVRLLDSQQQAAGYQEPVFTVATLPSGLYLVQVAAGSGEKKTIKIVKEN